MSLGSYRDVWTAHAGQLPSYLRENARKEVIRLIQRGDPVTDRSVADHLADMRTRKTRRGELHTPGAHAERLKRLRAGLEIVCPGQFGPSITSELQAIFPIEGKKPHRCPPPKRRGLSLEEWPPAKRRAWAAATRSAPSSYRRGGALAHLSRSRLKGIESALGIFYAFLLCRGEVDLTPAAVFAFLHEQRNSVREGKGPYASGTIAQLAWSIYVGERAFLIEAECVPERQDEFVDDHAEMKTHADDNREFDDACEQLPACSTSAEFEQDVTPPNEFEDDYAANSQRPAIDPLGWLRDQAVSLSRRSRPERDKIRYRVRLVDLVRYGLDLMDDADRRPYGEDAAVQHQLGLFMALLGLRCVRLSTILSTDIADRGAVAPNRGCLEMPEAGPWWLYWPSATVKTGVPIRTKVPEILKSRLTRQIRYYRDALRGAHDNAALFVSRLSSRRWSMSAARKGFEDAMEHRFHKRVWPHLVRSINAAFVSEEMPDQVLAGMVTNLLCHANPNSDEAYRHLVRGDAAQDVLERSGAAKLGKTSGER